MTRCPSSDTSPVCLRATRAVFIPADRAAFSSAVVSDKKRRMSQTSCGPTWSRCNCPRTESRAENTNEKGLQSRRRKRMMSLWRTDCELQPQGEHLLRKHVHGFGCILHAGVRALSTRGPNERSRTQFSCENSDDCNGNDLFCHVE